MPIRKQSLSTPYKLPKTKYLTEEEERRLLDACTGRRAHLRDLVLIALNTGLRLSRSELFWLRVGNCDFIENQIILAKHKGAAKAGQFRIIPMNSLVRAVLLRLCAKKQANTYVFTYPLTGKPYGEIKHAYRRACEAAELPKAKFNPSILYHTFGSRLARAGVDTTELRDLMENRKIELPMLHPHPIQAKQREAVERLVNKRVSSQGSQEPKAEQPPVVAIVNDPQEPQESVQPLEQKVTEGETI